MKISGKEIKHLPVDACTPRAARGRWDPEVKLWFIRYGKIKGTVLEKHIVLDASAMESIKQKAYNTVNLTGI